MIDLTDRIFLSHILESIERIEQYSNEGKDSFMNSILIQDAVIRNFEIIGEASKKLSDGVKTQTPDIPWRRIGDFRNLLIHDYARVDLHAVWSVVEDNLPYLKQAVQLLLRDAV